DLTKADWARLSKQWRSELDARIDALQRLRDSLTSCIGCGCLSLRSCSLMNQDDEMARFGPGAPRLKPGAGGGVWRPADSNQSTAPTPASRQSGSRHPAKASEVFHMTVPPPSRRPAERRSTS